VISNLCINYLSVFEVDIAKSYIYIYNLSYTV